VTKYRHETSAVSASVLLSGFLNEKTVYLLDCLEPPWGSAVSATMHMRKLCTEFWAEWHFFQPLIGRVSVLN
jgi:hypothetical protein